MRTPGRTERSRYSNGAIEQNFHMQLRAIYKLVLEWRRLANGWLEDDPQLVNEVSATLCASRLAIVGGRCSSGSQHLAADMSTLRSLGSFAESERIDAAKKILYAERGKRVWPGRDDKILADWNGLMIAALVNVATLFEEPEWIGFSARAYDFIVSAMQFIDAEGNKRLAHGWRAGVLVTPGLALDHAAMIRAALALHETRHFAPALASARDYLSDAIAWAEALETYHLDPRSGLLNMAAKDAGDVIVRLAPTSDDAIPNAHPVYLSALVRLGGLTGEARWLARADELFAALGAAARSNFVGHAGILNALDFRLRAKEIVTVGARRKALYEAALGVPFTGRIVVDIDRPDEIPEGHPAKAQVALAGDAAAFICAGGTCSLPVRDKQALLDGIGHG
jgi:hypothetical protein